MVFVGGMFVFGYCVPMLLFGSPLRKYCPVVGLKPSMPAELGARKFDNWSFW